MSKSRPLVYICTVRFYFSEQEQREIKFSFQSQTFLIGLESIDECQLFLSYCQISGSFFAFYRPTIQSVLRHFIRKFHSIPKLNKPQLYQALPQSMKKRSLVKIINFLFIISEVRTDPQTVYCIPFSTPLRLTLNCLAFLF